MARDKTYLAGCMTGQPAYGFALFDKGRDALRRRAWDVVSPADLDRADGFDPIKNPDQKPLEYEACMVRDKAAMKTCVAAHFLPGWQASKGANREMEYALKLGLDLYRCWWVGQEFHEELMETQKQRLILPKDRHTTILCSDNAKEPWSHTNPVPHEVLKECLKRAYPHPLREDSGGGLRLDTGKPRVELVPPSAMLAIAEVLGASSEPRGKYPERNWELGMAWSKTYAPAMRHLLAWWQGEDVDQESGLPHLWHALTDLAFAVEWARTGTGTDDRPGREAHNVQCDAHGPRQEKP